MRAGCCSTRKHGRCSRTREARPHDTSRAGGGSTVPIGVHGPQRSTRRAAIQPPRTAPKRRSTPRRSGCRSGRSGSARPSAGRGVTTSPGIHGSRRSPPAWPAAPTGRAADRRRRAAGSRRGLRRAFGAPLLHRAPASGPSCRRLPHEKPGRRVEVLRTIGVLADARDDQALAVDALDDGDDVQDQERQPDDRREDRDDAAEERSRGRGSRPGTPPRTRAPQPSAPGRAWRAIALPGPLSPPPAGSGPAARGRTGRSSRCDCSRVPRCLGVASAISPPCAVGKLSLARSLQAGCLVTPRQSR